MEAKKLRVGIIGAGRIAEAHINGINGAGATVSSISDVSSHQLTRIRQFAPQAVLTTDISPIYATSDIVVVSTPPSHHAEAAISALTRGIPVLVEKPLARTLFGAEEMLKAQEESGQMLLVHHSRGFERANDVLQKAIDSDVIGEILSMRFYHAHDAPPGWLHDEAQSGGAIVDLGVHHIDTARKLTGEEITVVDFRQRGYDEVGYGITETGKQFETHVSLEYAGKTGFEVQGTKGKIVFNYRGQDSVVEIEQGNKGTIDFLQTLVSAQGPDRFTLLWHSVIKSITQQTPFVADAHDAYKTLVTTLAFEQAKYDSRLHVA